jgi:digeranylgeranylglycerophospholipid reductase
MRVGIIGAGPAGLTAARILAQRGCDVHVFEEHPRIGEPVHCTGIVSSEFFERAELDESFIVNEVSSVSAHAGRVVRELPVKGSELILARDRFDQHLGRRAQHAGARIHVNHRVTSITDDITLTVRDTTSGEERDERFDRLIGAEGPRSITARTFGLQKRRSYYFTAQATIIGSFEPGRYEVHLGSIAPDYFAWVVPESRTRARAGIGSRANTRSYFEHFMTKRFGAEYAERVVAMQGAPIPLYRPLSRTSKGSVILAGDAAGHNKATTGGGIIPSIISGEIAALKALGEKRRAITLEVRLGLELSAHNAIRSILNRYDDQHYETLITRASHPTISAVLSDESREFPIKLLTRLALVNPRFLLAPFAFFRPERG